MNNNSKNIRKSNFLVPLIVCVVTLAAWAFYSAANLDSDSKQLPRDDFYVHFIDVGQGDCALIEAQGRFMLIDGGERGNEDQVTKYLKAQGVQQLDYVVATHPHSDHIGGLAYGILDNFSVGTVIAPRFSPENMPDTNTFEAFLQAVARLAEQGAKALYAVPGDHFALGEASFTVLGPLREYPGSYNNNSVIIQILFENSSVLFMGDAEKTVESDLAKHWGEALRADLLKAGHHGSKTSSNDVLLDLTLSSDMVISCGVGNSYGHPSRVVLERCKSRQIQVHRTDINGTIVFSSNGTSFTLKD